jgi:hypothetical protein
MAKIEDVNVKNFDDRWSWTNMAWMSQTEKGKKLALEPQLTDSWVIDALADHSSTPGRRLKIQRRMNWNSSESPSQSVRFSPSRSR